MTKNESGMLPRYLRVSAMLLIIIQSIGIRIFDGQGYVLSAIILFTVRDYLLTLTGKDFKNVLFIILFLVVVKIINPTFSAASLIYQILLVLTAYLFLKQYKDPAVLIEDFYSVLMIVFYHALIGYMFWVLIPGVFSLQYLGRIRYQTFMHIFYVADLSSSGQYRNNGICWEPGLLQMLLNLLLFFSIKNRKSYILQLLISITIITASSTTGFIILGMNYIFFIIKNIKTTNGKIIISLSLAFAVFGYAIGYQNITDKFNSENTSGLARLRDYYIGVELIKEKPILGHGTFTSEYLLKDPFVWNVESELFSKEYLETSGDMSGGYTNGLLGFIAWFGIPASIFIFILFYGNRFLENGVIERIIFFLIIIITCNSEPITNTSFFLLFPLSSLILKNHSIKAIDDDNMMAATA
jgi:hypothetical protein